MSNTDVSPAARIFISSPRAPRANGESLILEVKIALPTVLIQITLS